MSDTADDENAELILKIRRLVQERGWNQEDFARFTRLNRHTVRQILVPGLARKLRNATIMACADQLGLTVSELRSQPLEKLLPRMNAGESPEKATFRRLVEAATLPELKAWIERHLDRAGKLTEAEADEILSAQGDGGPLEAYGVEAFVSRVERRREVVARVHAIAAGEYLELMEQMIGLLYDKVRPVG